MGADAGVLGFLIKLQADAAQLIAELQKGEAAAIETTDNIGAASAKLAEQQVTEAAAVTQAQADQAAAEKEYAEEKAAREAELDAQVQAMENRRIALEETNQERRDAFYQRDKEMFLAGVEEKQRLQKEWMAAQDAEIVERLKAQAVQLQSLQQIRAAEAENVAIIQAGEEKMQAARLRSAAQVEAQRARDEAWYARWILTVDQRIAKETELAAVTEAQTVATAETAEATTSATAATVAWNEEIERQKVGMAELTAFELENAAATKEVEFSVRSMFPTLVNLRTLVRVATGIFAIGFIISEWKAFSDAIQATALAMGGFSEASQKAFAADIKANDEAISKAKDLATSHRNLADLEHQLVDEEQKRSSNIMENTPRWVQAGALYTSVITGQLGVTTALVLKMRELAGLDEARAKTVEQQRLAVENQDKLVKAEAKSTIEVLRAKADELDSSGQKQAALQLKLNALHKEEDAAVQEAGQNQSRIADLKAIYTSRAIELQNQLNYTESKGHKDTIDRLGELLQKEKDEAEALEQMGNSRIALTKRYDAVLREVMAAENEERRAGTFGAQQAQEAYDARNIALNIYREQLREIEEQEKEKQRREEEASNAFGLKQGGKELVEPWLKAEEAIGKYMQATEKATDADNIAADRSQKNAAAVAEAKLQEEIRVTESAAREALALDPFSKAYQAIVQYAEQQRLAAAFNKEESSIAAAVEKTTEALKKKSDAEEAALDRVRTPHAQSLLQVFREIQASKEHYDATMKQVAAATNLAATLRLQAQAEEVEAKATQDSAKAALLAADAKKKEKEATDLITASEKARKQASIEAKEADAEAVGEAAANLLTTLGFKKEAAIVDAIIQTAAGIADLAVFNYEGAALHFLSAAEYGIVAGQTPSRGSSVGAGTHGGQPGGSPGPLSAGATGSETPLQPGFTGIGGGGGPTLGGSLIVHVYGPSDEAQHISKVLNNYTQQQGGQLIASRAINPTKAGR